jgi:hypothetical protein
MHESARHPSELELGRGDRPRLSILLISTGDVRLLHDRVAACVQEWEELGAEMIVLRAGEADELNGLKTAYPAAVFAALPAGSSPGELRRAGVEMAAGDVVVIQSVEEPARDLSLPRLFPASLQNL